MQEQNLQIDDIFVSDKNKKLTMNDIIASYNTASTEKLNVKDTDEGLKPEGLMKGMIHSFTGDRGLEPASLLKGVTGEEGIKSTGFIQKSMVTTFTGEQGSGLMKSITDTVTGNKGLKLEPASFVKGITGEEGIKSTGFIQKSMVTTLTGHGEQGSSLMKSITDTVTGNEGLKLEPASLLKGVTGEEGIKSTGFIQKSMVTTLTGHGEQGSSLMKSITDTVTGNEGLKLEPGITGEEGIKSTGFIQKSMVTTFTGEQGSSLMKSITDSITSNEGLKLEPASFVKSVTSEEGTDFIQKSMVTTFTGEQGSSLMKSITDTITSNEGLKLEPASFVKGITGEEGIKSTGFIEKSMVTTLTGHGEQGSRLMKSIADTVIGNEGLKLEPASFVKSVTGKEGINSTGFIEKSMVTTLTGHGEQGSRLMKSIADTVIGNEGLKLEPASFVKGVTGEESTGFIKSVSDTFAGGEGLKLEAGSLVKDVMDTFTHNYELNLQATTAAVTSTSVEENKPKYELNVQPKANENVMTANVQSNDDYDEGKCEF